MEFFTERKDMSISEKYSWSSKIELFFYKFYNKITLSPIVIGKRSSGGIKLKVSKVTRVLGILMLIYACVHMGCLMVYPFFTDETEAFLNIWSIEMNLIPIFSTTLTILIEAQIKHSYLTEFLLLKQKIERDLRILCDPKQFEFEQYTSMKMYTRILFCFSVFTVIVYIMNIYRYSVVMVLFTSCLAMPRMFGQLRSFQHQLFTRTLHVYLKLLRMKCQESIRMINQCEEMAREQNCRHFAMNSKMIFNELILSIRILATIYRMAFMVNKIFGFSILALFLQDFIQLLTFVFWVYLKLYLYQLNDITGWAQHTIGYFNKGQGWHFIYIFRHFTSRSVHNYHHHSPSLIVRKLFKTSNTKFNRNSKSYWMNVFNFFFILTMKRQLSYHFSLQVLMSTANAAKNLIWW